MDLAAQGVGQPLTELHRAARGLPQPALVFRLRPAPRQEQPPTIIYDHGAYADAYTVDTSLHALTPADVLFGNRDHYTAAVRRRAK